MVEENLAADHAKKPLPRGKPGAKSYRARAREDHT